MEHPILYQTFKSKLIRCRRAVLMGEMTDDEVYDIFDRLIEELEQENHPEEVKRAYKTLEADLIWLERFERVNLPFGLGLPFVYALSTFISIEQLTRVEQIWSTLIELDIELADIEPGGEEH